MRDHRDDLFEMIDPVCVDTELFKYRDLFKQPPVVDVPRKSNHIDT